MTLDWAVTNIVNNISIQPDHGVCVELRGPLEVELAAVEMGVL